MQTLQESSVKIKKNRRKVLPGEKNFICGGCDCTYKSYPALYLHIKRKHNGIRPQGTKTSRPVNSQSKDRIHTGRPQKPSLDVDAISEDQMHIEQVQSELLGFLGEKLQIVSLLDTKPTLGSVLAEIIKISNSGNDEAMVQIKNQIENLSSEFKEERTNSEERELDFDSFFEMDKKNSLKILCWFLVWLGKYIVKFEALEDLTIIFSKIWAVIKQKQLEIQDLDNKLVWNGVIKECEPCLSSLTCFERKKELIYEFVSKLCHLIGKGFE